MGFPVLTCECLLALGEKVSPRLHQLPKCSKGQGQTLGPSQTPSLMVSRIGAWWGRVVRTTDSGQCQLGTGHLSQSRILHSEKGSDKGAARKQQNRGLSHVGHAVVAQPGRRALGRSSPSPLPLEMTPGALPSRMALVATEEAGRAPGEVGPPPLTLPCGIGEKSAGSL